MTPTHHSFRTQLDYDAMRPGHRGAWEQVGPNTWAIPFVEYTAARRRAAYFEGAGRAAAVLSSHRPVEHLVP